MLEKQLIEAEIVKSQVTATTVQVTHQTLIGFNWSIHATSETWIQLENYFSVLHTSHKFC